MKTTITLRLDPETREKLDLLAEASGYSPATLVAGAVRRFVDIELAALAAAQAEQAENGDGSVSPPVERWNLIV
jgi:predicted transcriptional regulator